MAYKKTIDFSDAPLISREQAKAEGLKRYFTGEPCFHGHIAPRAVSTKICVVCAAEYSLAYQKRMYLNHGVEFRERIRQMHARNPIPVLIRTCKNRAKRKGIEFTITAADLAMPPECPCCGNKLQARTGPRKPGPTPNSPSIDRVDNSRGYVPGNVAIICWRCNELKRNATPEELHKILSWIEGHTKKRLALVS